MCDIILFNLWTVGYSFYHHTVLYSSFPTVRIHVSRTWCGSETIGAGRIGRIVRSDCNLIFDAKRCIFQGCGSAFISSGSGSSILGWIPIRITSFNDQKLEKNYSWKKITEVTEEAFSSQKRPSSTSKHELSNFFQLLWVIFALLDPDPDSNPDPQPWCFYAISLLLRSHGCC
jgi:hypothetical protein